MSNSIERGAPSACGSGVTSAIATVYCDLLEHKWLLSEGAQRDIGLEAAYASYVAAGAPAPEVASGGPGLDLDTADPENMWAGGTPSEIRARSPG